MSWRPLPSQSLLLQLALVFIGPTDVNPAAQRPVVPLGSRLLQSFSYFTIKSNILVLIAAVLLARRPAR